MKQNIYQRIAALESRIAALESARATDIGGCQSTEQPNFPNDINSVNAPLTIIPYRKRQNGAYPVNRGGKVYWRMPAGAPIETLKPQSRKQRRKDQK